jgi:hypothetical protein
MGRRLGMRSRPAAGIAVAALALIAAVTGTALADDPATSSAVSKKKVKKIASKQVNKLAPGLSVAHATTADSATAADTAKTAQSANTAQSATIGGPIAYGKVDCTSGLDCEVIAAESRGLTDAMVTVGVGGGFACFDVPFSFRGAEVTMDIDGTGFAGQYRRGASPPDCTGSTDATTLTFTSGGGSVDSVFHIAFYR